MRHQGKQWKSFSFETQAFYFLVNADHDETEMVPHMIRHGIFNRALPIQVNPTVLIPHSPRCAIQFP